MSGARAWTSDDEKRWAKLAHVAARVLGEGPAAHGDWRPGSLGDLAEACRRTFSAVWPTANKAQGLKLSAFWRAADAFASRDARWRREWAVDLGQQCAEAHAILGLAPAPELG
ncbi:MAG: hypothetical protein ACREEW_13955, partial [Caulobacteraceae bacterium]